MFISLISGHFHRLTTSVWLREQVQQKTCVDIGRVVVVPMGELVEYLLLADFFQIGCEQK